jgi:FKBP-type peptidyl-prolyl cis-trans isomerase SlyD
MAAPIPDRSREGLSGNAPSERLQAARQYNNHVQAAYRLFGSARVPTQRSSCREHPPMNVFANTVVTITFKLFDAGNRLIEEAGEPIAYLHGGHSGIFPKIEEALSQKKVGESISVTLEPPDAFGEYDPEMVRVEPLANLPSDVTIGGHLIAEQDGQEVVWRVTDVADGKAVLDGNHELAGQRLRFDCTVLDIRPATKEEITHGHVHGAGGHHH